MIAFVLAGLEFHAGNAELALNHASEGLAAFRALNYTQSNARLLCNMSVFPSIWDGTMTQRITLARRSTFQVSSSADSVCSRCRPSER